jgi:hypothetical protein
MSDLPCPTFAGPVTNIEHNLVSAIVRSVDEAQVPVVRHSSVYEFGQAYEDAKPYRDRTVLLHNLTSGGGSLIWLSPTSSSLFCVAYSQDSNGRPRALVRWIGFSQKH